jgi:hypothetical protein
MSESYKKAIEITTAGRTGTFVGFQNGITAQAVNISGTFIYNSSKAQAGLTGITLGVAGGAIVPINCTKIQPSTHNVLGFMV